MLNLAPALKKALSVAKPQPVWLVKIEISSSRSYCFASKYYRTPAPGQPASYLAPDGVRASIVDVVSVACEKDPFTGEYSAGSCEVVFRNKGAVRTMIRLHRLKGRAIYVWLGAVGVDQQDWEPVFTGCITDYPSQRETISIHAEDATSVLMSREVAIDSFARHPLDIGLDGVNDAHLPGVLFSGITFDPAQYDAGTNPLSHWSVIGQEQSGARGLERETTREPLEVAGWPISSLTEIKGGRKKLKWGDPMPVKSLLSEFAEALGGSFLPDEDGEVRFKRYDPNRTVDRQIAPRDIVDVETEGVVANLTNLVKVSFGISGGRTLKIQDDASVAEHVFTGETERAYESEAKCAWANGDAELRLSIGTGDAEIVVDAAGQEGFTGTNYNLAGWNPTTQPIPAQDSWRVLDGSGPSPLVFGTRVAYLMITFDGDTAPEIVKAAYATPDDTALFRHNPPTGRLVIDRWTYGVERGVFDTTPRAHAAGERVYDITIPVAMALARLQRFGWGCPEAEIHLRTLKHTDLQVGDFIGFDDATQAWYDRNGISASVTAWEIVRKEIDLGDRPGVHLKVLCARDSAALPGNTLSYSVPAERDSATKDIAKLGRDQTFGNVHVVGGFEVIAGSSAFAASISAGDAASASTTYVLPEDIEIPVKPERDTYVYVDPPRRGFLLIDVANGSPAPATPTGTVLRALVEADASAITAITQYEVKALDGAKLTAGSVPTSALAIEASGLGVRFTIRVQFTAGVPGTADDVTIYPNLPFSCRVVDSAVIPATAIGGSTLQFRDAPAGGGKALSDAFSSASTGRKRDTATATLLTEHLSAGDDIYLRRSDRGVDGTAIIDLVKTT